MENEFIEINFSKGTLTKSVKGLAVIPVANSKWSDPESPRRVISTNVRVKQRVFY